jgi:hypothetical protein
MWRGSRLRQIAGIQKAWALASTTLEQQLNHENSYSSNSVHIQASRLHSHRFQLLCTIVLNPLSELCPGRSFTKEAWPRLSTLQAGELSDYACAYAPSSYRLMLRPFQTTG